MSVDDLQDEVRPGTILAGKYRVERVLGKGGMGVVVAAHHLQLDEKVALKFLLPAALANMDSVARFMREARAAVKIKSEHVARVSDVGQLENGSPYMVMEYLNGRDLAEVLAADGPVPIEQAVEYMFQACEAIAEAHSLGIVHRDLKPANLFRIQRSDGQPSIKVLDFGISKMATGAGPGHDLTRTSALMGSPLYMSPEQLQMAKGVDARSDIWALGVIFFELVTGQPPFNGEAITDLAIKIASTPAPTLGSYRGGVPPALEPVIAKCLQKDRAARFQNVGELVLALAPFAPARARISIDRVLGTLRQAGTAPPEPNIDALGRTVPVAASSLPQTTASWGRTGGGAAPTSSGNRGLVIALVAIVSILVVALVGVGIVMKKPAAAAASAAASPMTSEPIASSLPAAAPPPPSPTLTIAAAPDAAPAAPAPSGVAPTKPGARPLVPAQQAHAPSAGAPPAASSPPPVKKANCSPPYFIDAAGDRQYKPECL